MNIISSNDGQGVYMIPKDNISGVSYGDYYNYQAAGQLWMFGGRSDSASSCGLAYADSSNAWTDSHSVYSARLAYCGPLNRVTTSRFKQLAS